LKLFQEWGRGGKKENDGGENSSMIHLIYCKNVCKCYNVSPSKTVQKSIGNKGVLWVGWREKVN
jgi:hypothetical protein